MIISAVVIPVSILVFVILQYIVTARLNKKLRRQGKPEVWQQEYVNVIDRTPR